MSVVFSLCSLLSTAALAADESPPPEPDTSRVRSTGDLRTIVSLPPDYVVNTDGATVGQGAVVDQRVRVGAEVQAVETLSVDLEADLYNGQIAGDPWDLGPEDSRHRDTVGIDQPDRFSLRQASVRFKQGRIDTEAGLMLSHWGLGMLANDGAHDPVGFGRTDFGDRVLRARFTAAPFSKDGAPVPLLLTGTVDYVVEDEIGSIAEGQQAWQGVGSVMWRDPEGLTAGLYGVYRDQTEADGRKTRVSVADAYVRSAIALGERSLVLQAEGVTIHGTTDRATSWNGKDGLAVHMTGVAGQADVDVLPDKLDLVLRGGWTSGDGNPDDDRQTVMSLDRDFDVGMVMFDEFGGAIAQGAVDQLTDPEYAGQPPDGVDALATEGAVRQASFVQPILAVRPMPWLQVKAGAVMAWSTAPISQPFASYRNGGVPANHLGEPTEGRALGTELDWALKLGGTEVRKGRLGAFPELMVQGGHLLPSADYGGADTGLVNLFMGTARVRW